MAYLQKFLLLRYCIICFLCTPTHAYLYNTMEKSSEGANTSRGHVVGGESGGECQGPQQLQT